jgi:hypothetical protein
LKSFLPGMKEHLRTNSVAGRYHLGFGKPKKHYPAPVEDFALIFKEHFCVAADGLASHLNLPLDRLGVLFEEPVSTGTVSRSKNARTALSSRKLSSIFSREDLERGVGNAVFHNGQFLFVVQHLEKYEVDNVAAHGYRFAAIAQIAELVSRSMQVPAEDISSCLDRMKDYSVTGNHMEPGVHIAAFILRPKITSGFDVLVPIKTKHQLPTVALPFETLSSWQLRMLENLNDRRIADILQELLIKEGWEEAEQNFRRQFYRAINKLVEAVGDQSFITQAKFSAKVVQARCHNTPPAPFDDGGNENCSVLSFRMITSIHDRPPNNSLTYASLKFFNAQQQVLDRVACGTAFVRDAREEFAHCQESLLGKSSQKRLSKSIEKLRPYPKRKTPPTLATPSSSLSIEMRRGEHPESHNSELKKEPEPDGFETWTRETGSLSSMELIERCVSQEGGVAGVGGLRRGTKKRRHMSSTFVDELYDLFLAEQ